MGEWDESKHPRSDGGKFSSSGGGAKKPPGRRARASGAAKPRQGAAIADPPAAAKAPRARNEARAKERLAAARARAKERAAAIVAKAKERAKAAIAGAKAKADAAKASGKKLTPAAKTKLADARKAAKAKAATIVAAAKERARAAIAKASAGKAAKRPVSASQAVGSDHAERLEVSRRVVAAGGSATDHDVAVVMREAARIPAPALRHLESAGVKILASRESITDAVPALRGVKPRGWPPGSSWDSVPGIYQQDTKNVVIATHAGDGGRRVPDYGGGHGSVNLVAHESGHALDHALGWESSTHRDFLAAYEADKSRGKLDEYLTQPGNAGRQEAYAESFAAHVAGENPRGQFESLLRFWGDRYGKR